MIQIDGLSGCRHKPDEKNRAHLISQYLLLFAWRIFMDKLLSDIWGKISSYNIYVNLFPGAVFVFLYEKIAKTQIFIDNVFANIVICYFAGFVINRISSVVIEELLKRVHNKDGAIAFLHRAKYKDYISAAQKDEFIKLMNECNNVFRAFITVFSLLITTALISGYKICDKETIILVLLTILFLLSFRKQTKMIKNRVNKINGKEE